MKEYVMNRYSRADLLMVLLAGAASFCASAATRIVLNDSSATASSSYNNRYARFAVNGAGLNPETGEHSTGSDNVIWMSNTGSAVSGSWFRVDLGRVYPLDSFKLWNCNFWHATVPTTNRGIYRAEVYLSSLATTPGSDFGNAAEWTRVIDVVTFAKAPGLATYTGEPPVSLAGLTGRWFALRVLANFGGSGADLVGISELQIFADLTPIVRSSPPTAVGASQATLIGTLDYDGGIETAVDLFWGTSDGGTVSSAWDHAISLGAQSVGAISGTVAVAADNAYAFRFRASNASGTNWSDAAVFITAPVSVEMPASVSEGAATLPVTFRRPAGLARDALIVNYEIGGTAAAGADYLPPSGSILIPAGAETAQLNISLIDNTLSEPEETFAVSLLPGPYLVTSEGTASTVITDDDGAIDTSRWFRRMTVTLAGYAGASTLNNFPVCLRLSEQIEGFRYADFSSPADGGDLRVTDAATGEVLPYEIERWNPSGTSIVWVAIASLRGTNSAVTLHWTNPSATLPAYATNGVAWEYGFGGVWHLGETNSRDSTLNANHGTGAGNVTVAGVIGPAQYFDGNDYVAVPDHASIGAHVVTSLSVSTWFKSDVLLTRTNDTYRLLEKGDNYFFIQGYGSAGGIVFFFKQNDTTLNACGNGADISAGEWHHACGTYDGAAMRLYLDGVLVNSVAKSGPIDDDKLPLRIGSDDSGKYFRGSLDETRVERTVRSADWVKACYDSQKPNSAFAVFGPVVLEQTGTLIMLH